VASEAFPRRGLIVDWGGVMTSSVFASFAAFCRDEGLPADRIANAFRTHPKARPLLSDLERGTINETAFEQRFAKLLGLASHDSLIDRLFGSAQDDHAMQDAVVAFRRAGVRTGLLSNSWGVAWYQPVAVEPVPVVLPPHRVEGPVGHIRSFAAGGRGAAVRYDDRVTDVLSREKRKCAQIPGSFG